VRKLGKKLLLTRLEVKRRQQIKACTFLYYDFLTKVDANGFARSHTSALGWRLRNLTVGN